MNKFALVITLTFLYCNVFTQYLQPGFNGSEYTDMLALNFQRFDTAAINLKIPAPANYTNVYRSPDLGLRNRWNMWYRNDNKVGVISLRGTVNELPSWIENYYAAMVPATGTLQINDSTQFVYQLSADEKAHVHIGWLTGLAHLAPGITEQVQRAYAKGIHEFIIIGHSQGGALATLTRSYLYYLTEKGGLPKDIVFKTYCSAAPKVGNLYYAYDFDFITRNGWAFTVLNAADWVPETLFSVQTVADFNPLNPFTNINSQLKDQPIPVRWVLKYKYKRLKNGVQHAQRRFERNLGGLVFKFVKKTLPQLREPMYVHDNNYQRAGVPIVLQPDAAYYQIYPITSTNIFMHHLFAPYYLLAKKYYGDK
ncbi:MAG: lipase family protein [Chitinophagaceae bacterium]